MSTSRSNPRPLRINPYNTNIADRDRDRDRTSPDVLLYPNHQTRRASSWRAPGRGRDRDRDRGRGGNDNNLERLGLGLARLGFIYRWFGRVAGRGRAGMRDPDDIGFVSGSMSGPGSHRLTDRYHPQNQSTGNPHPHSQLNLEDSPPTRTKRFDSNPSHPPTTRTTHLFLFTLSIFRTPRRAMYTVLGIILFLLILSTLVDSHDAASVGIGAGAMSRARGGSAGGNNRVGVGRPGRVGYGGYRVRWKVDQDSGRPLDDDDEDDVGVKGEEHDEEEEVRDRTVLEDRHRAPTRPRHPAQAQREKIHPVWLDKGRTDLYRDLPRGPIAGFEKDVDGGAGGVVDRKDEQERYRHRSQGGRPRDGKRGGAADQKVSQVGGDGDGDGDAPEERDEDGDENDKDEIFEWRSDTGLRVLTEQDLYDNDADDDDTGIPPIDDEIDLEAEQDEDDDHAFFEEETEDDRQARIQAWREKNRRENRMPLDTLVGGYLDQDERDGVEPAWFEGLEEEMKDDGDCKFSSPVEAYQRALTRLRKAKLSKLARKHANDDVNQEGDELPGDAADESLEDITQEDIDRFSHPALASHTLPNLPGAHRYSPTGHLVISPDEAVAEHPIPQLLKLGERRWEEMIGRQSRTLNEAVDEYTRRYGRAPPRGFDVWWGFAQENSLLLPDEYDRIHLDLAPFWALPRTEMRKRVREAMDVKETFVLIVENGTVSVEVLDIGGLDWGGTLPRAKDTASLIRPFAQHLPDMRAVFSIHDQPQIYVSASRRQSLIELGLRGEHTKHLNESDSSEIRWDRSCRRESNLRNPNKHEVDQSGSLVYDTSEATDMCKNPYLLDLHGFTVEKRGPASHPKPRTNLMPLFGLAKTSINSDILVTPLDQFADAPGFDPPWRFKRSQRVAWRGSTTGISFMDKSTPWEKSHRFRLHSFAQNASEADLTFMVPDIGTEGGPLRMKRETGPTGNLSAFFYDMKLAGEPLQCSEEDGTCDEIANKIDFAELQPAEELNDYKFLFDIDGNSWSGRFRRLMNTKSLVLKTGIFTEWFQPHLIPWFSYIPTRLDFSDLPMILSFLRGSPEAPEDGFDEVAEALANNGRCFTRKIFRVEDMQAYMFRLFLEYARLMAPTDHNVDFVFDPSMTDEGEVARINTPEFFAQDSKIWRKSDEDEVESVKN